MLDALLWGLVGASSLVLGAVVGLRLPVPRRVVGLLLGFGAGTLISAVSFELATEALADGGGAVLAGGLALGGIAFYAGDRLIDRIGGASGGALALGALLDGVPEQAALGLGLAGGASVSVALLAAIFISNLPEAVGSAADMRDAGRDPRRVLGLWLAVALVVSLATPAGYALLGDASGRLTGLIQAVAAGAILVMLIDSMVPEAARAGGRGAGLVTVLGYAVAALLFGLRVTAGREPPHRYTRAAPPT